MPAGIELPDLDAGGTFREAELRRAERYERFLRANWALAVAAQLAALTLLVRWAPRVERRLRGGRIVRGLQLALIAFALVWVVRVPFGLAALWWRRRYGLSRLDYLSWLVEPWTRLVAELLVTCVATAVAMALALRLGRRWWLAGAPAFALVGAAALLVQPLFLAPRLEPLRDRALAGEIRSLARETGVGPVTVEVERVSHRTTVANAEVLGLGPTKRVVLWDTLLDGRFQRGEVTVIAAHELAHVARDHVWRSLGWFGLIAVPGVFLLAQVTRLRGGLGEPAAVPLGILTLVALQLLLLPAVNAVSRRYEAEADWLALEATRDPDSARGLFRRFVRTSLADPDPPGWSYVLLETHPSVLERLAMVEAWRGRRDAVGTKP